MKQTESGSHANHRSRMRERYKRCGMEGFAEHEALEVYLYRCLYQMNTNDIAHNLLKVFGSLSNIFAVRNAECYESVPMIGKKTAFALRNSAECMDKAMLERMHTEPSYNGNTAMVFARYMLRRIPQESVLVLRYDLYDRFLNYAILPKPEEDPADWILQCLAATKASEHLHIWVRDNDMWSSEKCLQIGSALLNYTRKLRSIRRMHISGKADTLYE